MIAIVVGLSFVVLMLAFRSLVIPAKAAIMNLLSVGAAYGVVTAVFQEGWGASLIGLEHSIPIVSFVPLLMFAILFGLSMDYEVSCSPRQEDDEESKRRPRGDRGTREHGPGEHLGGADHGLRLHELALNGDPAVEQFGVGLRWRSPSTPRWCAVCSSRP